MRKAGVERSTKETSIAVAVDLDGSGAYVISTGIGFLDHMLEQLSRHSLIDVMLQAQGDLHVDMHHTTEDTAIALGEAVSKALGERNSIPWRGSKHFAPVTQLRRDTPFKRTDAGSNPAGSTNHGG